MKGYQADIDAEQQYTGQIYEERGRGFLALRGQAARVEAGSNRWCWDRSEATRN